jgi:hypothetical protein
MNPFQLIFVPLCSVMALLTLARVSRGRVSAGSGLVWMLLWAGGAALIAQPSLATAIAVRLGIGRGADLVLYLTTLGGLGASLMFYAQLRRLETMLTDVLRREALRDAQLGGRP